MSNVQSSDDYFCDQRVSNISSYSICTLPYDIQVEIEAYLEAQDLGFNIIDELSNHAQDAIRNL